MEEEEGGEEGLDEAAHEEQVEAYVEQTAQTAQAAAGEGGEEGAQREEGALWLTLSGTLEREIARSKWRVTEEDAFAFRVSGDRSSW